ncbi:ComEC/Rec2 family competence protein [Peptacetobacter sp.]|uniref:ComEC/Rec2 family competence protein n=2 Tax=Peptacetobacter sp. TaxID=2991975 RepID=UPI00261525DB|nr:ComEC/Rec2 family competence protein [Peptacetobacter sp.]
MYTNKGIKDCFKEENINITGVVMYKKEKDRYNQYRVGKSIVNDYSKNSNIKTGDIIKVVGKNKPLSNMKFEDFYYGRYLKSTGIENYCNMYKYKKIGINKKYELIGNIRRYIRETNRYLYKDKSDFLNSMLIGEKELIKDEDKRMFSRTGISHIIAISGLHVSILCAFIGFLGRRINITFNMIILNLVLYLYIYIAGGSPSIIRAVLSSVFSNIAFFIDRRKDGVTTLMIIASAMIIYNPFILYNISFQLSFLATFSIVYFYPIINKKIKLSIVSITIAANIMTMPIIIYNFKGISLLSLISNIMVVPFISLVIYLDIISLVIFNLFPFISVLISLFNSSIISYIHFILEKIDEIWFSYIRFTQLDFSFLIIYYIIISLGIIYYEIKVVEEQRNELQGYYRGNERK